MSKFIPSISRLIDEFARLPGVGKKSAQRLAFHIINMDQSQAVAFAEAILDVKRKVKYCEKCFNITDQDICDICTDNKRDTHLICVVETPRDLIAIENTKEFHGYYHVLHGAISPMEGIGPNDIKIKELIIRLQNDETSEIIIATNPSIEGEATAMYISKLLKGTDISVTRLAHGIPVGGDLEYADEVTLAKAIEGRRTL
ncbi:recombination mediator RecR [Fusibacter bizertensis]|jgi:recombination protein RecR|uniref:Recombination protein RecR n=1 Tax=Fusibacter bizertensis TaxID=1488331 RepID=A0ABT6NFQ9_9FIRM|nr:recombination mediator RecR [Fusibacter bizertensis]MDH8679195.1 recombination mediator RecR [Fusibacter bizertensis]